MNYQLESKQKDKNSSKKSSAAIQKMRAPKTILVSKTPDKLLTIVAINTIFFEVVGRI